MAGKERETEGEKGLEQGGMILVLVASIAVRSLQRGSTRIRDWPVCMFT